MAAIRPIDVIAAKWATVTPQRTEDYQRGVATPRVDWQRVTAGSAQQWQAGIQAAIANNAFQRGVQATTTAEWQNASLEKGASRWGPGVQLAQEKYQRAFAPFRDAIERVQLPPRGPRGDARNFQRVSAIAEALRRVKLGRTS